MGQQAVAAVKDVGDDVPLMPCLLYTSKVSLVVKQAVLIILLACIQQVFADAGADGCGHLKVVIERDIREMCIRDRPTGKGQTISRKESGGMTVTASGFFMSLPSLAKILLLSLIHI